MTPEGPYPPGAAAGSDSYQPDGDPGYDGYPTRSAEPGGGRTPARAAVRIPGLRVEAPADEPVSPSPSGPAGRGQVYGRPNTYGAAPEPAEEPPGYPGQVPPPGYTQIPTPPPPPAPPGSLAGPRVYGQPQGETLRSGERPAAGRPPVPGQRGGDPTWLTEDGSGYPQPTPPAAPVGGATVYGRSAQPGYGEPDDPPVPGPASYPLPPTPGYPEPHPAESGRYGGQTGVYGSPGRPEGQFEPDADQFDGGRPYGRGGRPGDAEAESGTYGTRSGQGAVYGSSAQPGSAQSPGHGGGYGGPTAEPGPAEPDQPPASLYGARPGGYGGPGDRGPADSYGERAQPGAYGGPADRVPADGYGDRGPAGAYGGPADGYADQAPPGPYGGPADGFADRPLSGTYGGPGDRGQPDGYGPPADRGQPGRAAIYGAPADRGAADGYGGQIDQVQSGGPGVYGGPADRGPGDRGPADRGLGVYGAPADRGPADHGPADRGPGVYGGPADRGPGVYGGGHADRGQPGTAGAYGAPADRGAPAPRDAAGVYGGRTGEPGGFPGGPTAADGPGAGPISPAPMSASAIPPGFALPGGPQPGVYGGRPGQPGGGYGGPTMTDGPGAGPISPAPMSASTTVAPPGFPRGPQDPSGRPDQGRPSWQEQLRPTAEPGRTPDAPGYQIPTPSLAPDGGSHTSGELSPVGRTKRRGLRIALWVAVAVVVIGGGAGALYYTSLTGAPSYKVGTCVTEKDTGAVQVSCTTQNAFKVTSKVSDPASCPDTKQPYVKITESGKTTYVCLVPAH